MNKPVLRILASSLALAAVLLSCGDNIVDPDLPAGAAAFTPPAYFATWWEMTKACSARSGSLSDVRWYKVPGSLFSLKGESVSAYWSAGSNQIVLAENVIDDGQVVRHEMLHALLGDKGHARENFLERCSGYVTCTSQCVQDAGPAPAIPATVPRVAPTALEVTVVIEPNVVRASVNSGYFTVKVLARNPAGNPVVAVLPGESDPPPVSFMAQFIGPSGESQAVFARDPSAVSFAAGETKVHAFDFFVDNQAELPRHIFPGIYNLRGTFGGHGPAGATFQSH